MGVKKRRVVIMVIVLVAIGFLFMNPRTNSMIKWAWFNAMNSTTMIELTTDYTVIDSETTEKIEYLYCEDKEGHLYYVMLDSLHQNKYIIDSADLMTKEAAIATIQADGKKVKSAGLIFLGNRFVHLSYEDLLKGLTWYVTIDNSELETIIIGG